ncbi:protein amnionless [Spodoptera litura]|uniref:Protein amnionless n=1 Tax=Spodoptera litura TaxID=69820 RepID=A0A9J7IJI2_SPOLT|nr:protein amnionless [Spodoptera litura]
MSPIVALHCLVIFGTSLISATTVTWLPNSSFKLPDSFKDRKLPCSKQTVVFPQTIVGSVEIASETKVGGFILPEDGELILEGLLSFGADPADTNCTEGNAYYIDKTGSSWNQADVWSSPKFNKATPDSDRIPCFNDIVVFPKDTKTTVTLPSLTQYVKEIRIGNDSFTNTAEFRDHITLHMRDDTQQFVVNDYSVIGVTIGHPMRCSQFGCACQNIPLEIDCSAKFCPKPECVEPIKPLGFCCDICGGYLLFDADEGFDMKTFGELVEGIAGESGKNDIEYYIGFTPEIPFRRIQLVVVDKGEYEGSSAEIINSISYALHDHWVKGHKVAQISGSPLYKAGLGGKIFVSMFFAVILTLGALYVYYYKIPELRIPIVSRHMPAGIFSRFDRRSDSVVSLTRRDSVISAASRSNTAFRNPLYNSKRGRVQVTESASVAEE